MGPKRPLWAPVMPADIVVDIYQKVRLTKDDDVRFYCRYGITMMMIDMSLTVKYAYINILYTSMSSNAYLYSHIVQIGKIHLS